VFALFRKEVSQFFGSVVAYVIMGTFLAVVGLLLWVFPDTNLLDYGYADLSQFFVLTPYVLLLLAPAVTMRALSDERRAGTLEWLLTKPISRWGVVVGKFGACWVLVALTLLPTLLYAWSLYRLGSPAGNLDLAVVAGSYVGLLLLAGVFVAVGLWASSLNDNQVVAFVIGAVACLLLYAGLSTLGSLFGATDAAYWLDYFSLDSQYAALGRGLLDSRNVVYLLSLLILFLALTERNLQRSR
jgi:ABC-2 type transport system permease protein